MILIITNKKDYTADYLIISLKSLGIDFFRLNTEDFPNITKLVLRISNDSVNGYFEEAKRLIDLKEIHSVWYRRPRQSNPSPDLIDSGARDFVIVESRETLEGLWRILPAFWVSAPDKITKAESKIYQLINAVELGFVIPSTLITNNPKEVEIFNLDCESIIYKPLKKGRIVRGDNVSYIYTSKVDQLQDQNFENVEYSPSLFQSNIKKYIDVRVTVVGEKVFAAEIHSQEIDEAKQDWRRVEVERIHHAVHTLPYEVEIKCVSLVKKLGLKFGAIDLVLTKSREYIFLEINPNGQWAWIQELCPDLRIREALIDLLVSNGDSDERRTKWQ